MVVSDIKNTTNNASTNHHRKISSNIVVGTEDAQVEDSFTKCGPAVACVALVKSILFFVKATVPTGLIQAFLRKKAFLAIGQRTTTATLMADHLLPVKARTNNYNTTMSKLETIQSTIGGFLKNGLLGFAVFGVYDVLVFHIWSQRNDTTTTTINASSASSYSQCIQNHSPVMTADLKLVWMQSSLQPNGEASPVWIHFGAGAASGVAQSLVEDSWELTKYGWQHRHRVLTKHHWGRINTHVILRRLIDHSVGFATLFGTYEWIRRSLVHWWYDHFTSGAPSVPKILSLLERYNLIVLQDGCYDMTIVPITTSFVAGGMAGQLHYVVSHYLRQWKALAPHHRDEKLSIRNSSSRWRLPKPPQIRSIATAFGPTALCFVAFQYGGELMGRLLTEDSAHHPFPVYIHQNYAHSH